MLKIIINTQANDYFKLAIPSGNGFSPHELLRINKNNLKIDR